MFASYGTEGGINRHQADITMPYDLSFASGFFGALTVALSGLAEPIVRPGHGLQR